MCSSSLSHARSKHSSEDEDAQAGSLCTSLVVENLGVHCHKCFEFLTDVLCQQRLEAFLSPLFVFFQWFFATTTHRLRSPPLHVVN